MYLVRFALVVRQRDGYLQLVADRGLVPQVVVRGRAAVAVAGQLGQVLPVLVLQDRGQEDDAVGVLLVVVDAFVGQFQRRVVAVQRLHQRVVGGRAALRIADDVPLAVVAAFYALFLIAVVARRLVLARPRHDVLLVPLVELHRHRLRPREGLHEEAVSPRLAQRVARGNNLAVILRLRLHQAATFHEDRHGVGTLGLVCRRGERPVAVRHVHLAVRLVRVGNRAAVGSGEGVVPRTLIVVVVVVVQVHVVALRVVAAVVTLVGHAGGLEGQRAIVAPVHRELGHRLFSLKTAQCEVFLVFYPAHIIRVNVIIPSTRHRLFHHDAFHTIFKCLVRGRVVHSDIITFYIANPYLSPAMVDSFQWSIGILSIIFLPLFDQVLGAVGCHQINLSFV